MESRKFSAFIDELISESELPSDEIINILVSKIQALRKPVATELKMPESDGWYSAIVVGHQHRSRCYYLDGEWFLAGKSVRITKWFNGQ